MSVLKLHVWSINSKEGSIISDLDLEFEMGDQNLHAKA